MTRLPVRHGNISWNSLWEISVDLAPMKKADQLDFSPIEYEPDSIVTEANPIKLIPTAQFADAR